jgi:non-ribosomal peptide synthetase component F
MIGFFVNTLVLRIQSRADKTFEQLMERVREVCLGAYANQDIPFQEVLDERGALDADGRQTLYRFMLVSLSALEEPLLLPNLEWASMDFDHGTAKCDLALHFGVREQRLCGYFEYDTEVLDVQSVRSVARHFEALISAAMHHPGSSLAEFAMPAARVASPRERPSGLDRLTHDGR